MRNIMMLSLKGLRPGEGWGCVTCDLAFDGALAVVCDDCLKHERPLVFVVDGYLSRMKRAKYEELFEPFDHDLAKHREEQPIDA